MKCFALTLTVHLNNDHHAQLFLDEIQIRMIQIDSPRREASPLGQVPKSSICSKHL